MPAEKASMRCVREILHLKHACGASDRVIARSTGVARSTVGDYLARAAAAGLGWPLPAMLTDAALEALLFAKAGTTPGHAAGRSRAGPRSIASAAGRASR